MIFPVIILIGVVLGIITLGAFNPLFWLVLPSIVFEQLFEQCCTVMSDNMIANAAFALLFWFLIGSTTQKFSAMASKYLRR